MIGRRRRVISRVDCQLYDPCRRLNQSINYNNFQET